VRRTSHRELIEAVEKLLEKAEKLDVRARTAMRGSLHAETLKKSFELEWRWPPVNPVQPGDGWERTEVSDASSGLTFTLRKKYEYMGAEIVGDRVLDKIRSKATEAQFKQDSVGEPAVKIVKSDVKVETSDAIIFFDRHEGHVVNSRESTRIKGDMTFLSSGSEIASTIDLTIESSSELLPAVN
jgi:hypothetical protein